MYLVLYNLFSTAAWGYTAFLAITHLFVENGAYADLFEAVELPLKIAQTTALLEIVHAMTGLVRSSVFTTFLQVTSRIFLLWAICDLVPESRSDWGFALMILSWCAVEIPRYLFYALKELNAVPYILTWIRYSLFMVLYPSGISGELLCATAALPFIKEREIWTLRMPNQYNFPFDYYYFCIFALFVYIPGSPVLYSHMLKLRSKMLARENEKAKTA